MVGGRLAGIEILRAAAVLAIVWFHTGAPATHYLQGRLACLLLMSVALPAYGSVQSSFRQFAAVRARRLLMPWAFWSVVYGIWAILRQTVRHEPVVFPFTPAQLLAGTSVHLWYLPFALAASLGADRVRYWLRDANPAAVCGAATTVGCAALLGSAAVWSLPGLQPPLPQYLFGVPSVPLGLAAATARRAGGGRWLVAVVSAVLFVFVAVAFLAGPGGVQAQAVEAGGLLFRYALGMTLFCACFAWDMRMPKALFGFSSLALGVYLVHPLVDSVVVNLRLVERGTTANGLAVVTLSLLFARLLSLTPLRRFV